jgi:hypothetical protein
MPNLDTQPMTKVSAQLVAEVEQSRIASAQCVDLSITVNRWVWPSADAGRDYQVDVDVAESPDRVGDVAWWGHRLRNDLGLLALLSVPTPGCHLGHQARSGRPDAWVRQAVHSIEDSVAKGGGD